MISVPPQCAFGTVLIATSGIVIFYAICEFLLCRKSKTTFAQLRESIITIEIPKPEEKPDPSKPQDKPDPSKPQEKPESSKPQESTPSSKPQESTPSSKFAKLDLNELEERYQLLLGAGFEDLKDVYDRQLKVQQQQKPLKAEKFARLPQFNRTSYISSCPETTRPIFGLVLTDPYNQIVICANYVAPNIMVTQAPIHDTKKPPIVAALHERAEPPGTLGEFWQLVYTSDIDLIVSVASYDELCDTKIVGHYHFKTQPVISALPALAAEIHRSNSKTLIHCLTGLDRSLCLALTLRIMNFVRHEEYAKKSPEMRRKELFEMAFETGRRRGYLIPTYQFLTAVRTALLAETLEKSGMRGVAGPFVDAFDEMAMDEYIKYIQNHGNNTSMMSSVSTQTQQPGGVSVQQNVSTIGGETSHVQTETVSGNLAGLNASVRQNNSIQKDILDDVIPDFPDPVEEPKDKKPKSKNHKDKKPKNMEPKDQEPKSEDLNTKEAF